MVNVKGVLPVGDGQIDGWFSHSDRREQDYQDMSLGMLDRLGYGSDNTFPALGNWPAFNPRMTLVGVFNRPASSAGDRYRRFQP